MLNQMNSNQSQNNKNSEIYKKPIAISDGSHNDKYMNNKNKKGIEQKYDSKYHK